MTQRHARVGWNSYCENEAATYFGTKDVKELRKRMTGLVRQINAQVRAGVATAPSIEEIKAHFGAMSLRSA